MDTEQHPVANWGAVPLPNHEETIDAALRRVFYRAYHRGHLHGFLLGIAAGGALASAIAGVLVYS